MNAQTFGLLLAGVLLNAVAQLLLKAGTNTVGEIRLSASDALPLTFRLATEPHIVAGIACYVVSVAVWIVALSRVEVSVAYPMLSIGYIVNAIAAYYLLGEAVTPLRLAGIGVIVLGVFMVARSG
jgi:multidrug transporter EmrE-like cation transporter